MECGGLWFLFISSAWATIKRRLFYLPCRVRRFPRSCHCKICDTGVDLDHRWTCSPYALIVVHLKLSRALGPLQHLAMVVGPGPDLGINLQEYHCRLRSSPVATKTVPSLLGSSQTWSRQKSPNQSTSSHTVLQCRGDHWTVSQCTHVKHVNLTTW